MTRRQLLYVLLPLLPLPLVWGIWVPEALTTQRATERLEATGVKVQGTVLESWDGGAAERYVRVAFEAPRPDGPGTPARRFEIVSHNLETTCEQANRPGARVDVLYEPADPTNAIALQCGKLRKEADVNLLFAGLMTLLTLGVSGVNLRAARRASASAGPAAGPPSAAA